MKKETAGALSLLAAGVLWGTTGTAQTFAPSGYDPLLIGLLRIAIGGLLLLLLVLGRDQLGPLHSWPLWPTLIGALTVAAFQVFFFNGIYKTGVAVGTIVGLGSAPVFAGLFAFLCHGERPARRWYSATLLAVAGCVLLLVASHRGHVQLNPFGMLLSIGAGVSYALYALAVKDLVVRKSPLAVMAVLACLGTVLILPLLWGRDFSWVMQPRTGTVALYLGLCSYAVPMVLFARGLSVTPIAVAVTLTLAEPMTAGILAVLVVGERLPFTAWCGLLMVLSGLVMLTVAQRRSPESGD